MTKLTLTLLLAVVAPSMALFFGGGGGGGCGGCSSCCAPPPPPCPPPPPPCPPPPPPCPPPPSCGCGGGGYAQPSFAPQIPSCRPRYIIVRPVESAPISAPIGGGYQSGPAPSYQPAPVASYQPAPVAAPAAPAPTSYQSAPAPSYQPAPVAAPVASYQSAPAAVAPAPASYNAGPSYQSKAAARASKTVLASGKCNSQELRVVLQNAIVAGDANESKRRVHKLANEQFSTLGENERGIDVICAPAQISYRVATDLFCEHTVQDITCFAYQQS